MTDHAGDQRREQAGLLCGTCGNVIQKEELAQGLAVRVDGELVCSMCVDTLPSGAQLVDAHLRAVRGLNVTTFQVPFPHHPQLHAYSFTTAANITQHRRQLTHSGFFPAPLLNRSEHGTADIARPQDETATSLPAIPAGSRLAVAGRGFDWRLAFAGGAICAGLVIWLVLANSGGSKAGTAPPFQQTAPAPIEPAPAPVVRTQPPEQTPPPAKPKRLDYASDPAVAWAQTLRDPDCPQDIIDQIAGEYRDASALELESAQGDIKAGRLTEAKQRLQNLSFPDHLAFRQLRAKLVDVRGALTSAQLAAEKPKPPAIIPESTPQTPPSGKIPEITPPPQKTVKTDPFALEGTTETEPGRESLLIPIEQMLSDADRDLWHKTPTGGIKLERATGVLERTLTLGGGLYQVWIEHRSEQKDGFLDVTLADQDSTRITAATGKQWVRVGLDKIAISSGACILRISASGRGEIIYRIYIGGADAAGPAEIEKLATWSAPTWQQSAQPSPAPAPAVQIWPGKLLTAGKIVDPLDERARVPADLPGNNGTVTESTMSRGHRTHSVAVDLSGFDINRGGIALVVHPIRSDRQKLLVTLSDGDDHVLKVKPLVVPPGQWSQHVIALNEVDGHELFAADRVKSLTIEDAEPLTTSFMVGKIAVVANKAPVTDNLSLRPPALLAISYRDLDRALTVIAKKRKIPQWRRDFWPNQMKVLVGPQLLLGEWDGLLSKGLKDVLKLEPLPAKTLDALVLQDDWLNTKLFAKVDPIVDPQKIHVLVISVAGLEVPAATSQATTFIKFWTDIIDQCLDHGILPVVVLGPDRITANEKFDATQLWDEVEKSLRKNRVGVPLIDLRAAHALSYNRFAPGALELSAQLLVDGYAEVLARINYLRAQPSK
jgi:hypothetical protein